MSEKKYKHKKKRCAYRLCTSRPEKETSSFSFPKDPDRARSWLKACNRPDLVNLIYNGKLHQNYRLCEKHFEERSVAKCGTKKRLWPSSVPTIFLPAVPSNNRFVGGKLDNEDANIKISDDPVCLLNLEPLSICSLETDQPIKNSMTENGQPTLVMTSGSGTSSFSQASNAPSTPLSTRIPSNSQKSSSQLPPGAQPQLVVLLDSNYGLPTPSNTSTKNTTVSTPKVHLSTNNAKNTVIPIRPKPTVNGTNTSQMLHAKPQGNANLRVSPTTSNSLNSLKFLNELKSRYSNAMAVKEKRCRSCLTTYPSTSCRSIARICYLDKTIKEAILQIIPRINIPLQETDFVCDECFNTLQKSLVFSSMFERIERILEFELKNKQDGNKNSHRSLPYPHLGNNNLEVADKIISLSKIDNNNLTKFVETLQLNQVKIFHDEKSHSKRKRVLLLGNPKWRICHICFKEFLTEGLLLTHIESEHNKEPAAPTSNFLEDNLVKCDVCEKAFTSNSNLNKHTKWCVNYACPHCKEVKKFPCNKLLEHTKTVHGDNFPFKCTRCKQQFGQYNTYLMHKCVIIHTCKKCKKPFESTDALKKHAKMYKDVPCNVPSKACSVCEKIVNMKEYSTHLFSHKKCKNSSNNEQKKTPVPKLKTFKCTECDKVFLKADTLLKHKETHEISKIEEQQTCEICNDTFDSMKNLEEHVANVHVVNHNETPEIAEIEEPQTCEVCNNTFDSMKNLDEHIAKDHGDSTVMCELCGEECKLINLKEHIESRHGSDMEEPESKEEIPKKVTEENETAMNEDLDDGFEGEESLQDYLSEEYIEADLSEIVESEEVVFTENDTIEEEEIEQEERQSIEENPHKRKRYTFEVNGPVTCKYCLKSFSNSQQLMKHTITHFQSKKNEKCSHCDLKFPTKISRIKHERSHEVSTKKLRCNICWRTMQNKDDLANHMTTHNNILSCDKCSEKFAYKWQLDKHYSSSHV